MPARDAAIRARLRHIASASHGQERLHRWLSKVDPKSGAAIAPGDRHRVERALEVWIVSGQPISIWQRPTPMAEEIPSIKIALALDRLQLAVQHKPVFRLYCAEAYQYAHRGTVYPYLMEIERLGGFDGGDPAPGRHGALRVQPHNTEARRAIYRNSTELPPGAAALFRRLHAPHSVYRRRVSGLPAIARLANRA